MQVTAFSRWEKVLPRLVEDSRYKAVPTPKERRQVFDDFCRNVAAEQKAVQARKEMQRWAGTMPSCCSGSVEEERHNQDCRGRPDDCKQRSCSVQQNKDCADSCQASCSIVALASDEVPGRSSFGICPVILGCKSITFC